VALRLHPHYPEAANNLGLVWLTQGKADAAAVQFREALQLRPDRDELKKGTRLFLNI
jgi:Tfp pilus assembly protein PilF